MWLYVALCSRVCIRVCFCLSMLTAYKFACMCMAVRTWIYERIHVYMCINMCLCICVWDIHVLPRAYRCNASTSLWHTWLSGMAWLPMIDSCAEALEVWLSTVCLQISEHKGVSVQLWEVPSCGQQRREGYRWQGRAWGSKRYHLCFAHLGWNTGPLRKPHLQGIT